ncbi:MAG: hypothetical protein HYS34_06705 [Acidobacteria bacterium]|nr:hypothetical protein [Acidobacteriota bacterium]
MKSRDDRNVAHKHGTHRRELAAASLLAAMLGATPAAPGEVRAAGGGAERPARQEVVPPPARPPEIQAPLLSPSPEPGKSRLALHLDGNRRWCTYPDDRLVRPPEKEGRLQKRNEVFTFGYQFTLAAVRRGDAATVLMLFESPVYRTATWRPASKVGMTQKSVPRGPTIFNEDQPPPRPKQIPKSPDTLVPYWEEWNRCVGLPERLEFDLDPGTYDVYAAFDLMKGDGSWVHRTTGFLTDVPVEAGRRTRLDGLINVGPGADRQVELVRSSIEPESALPEPAGP